MEKNNLKEYIRLQIKNNPQLAIKPLFLHCAVRWDEEDEVDVENYKTPSKGYENVIICLIDENDYNENDYGAKLPYDDKVLYYIHQIEELINLVDYENGSEFHLVDYFYSEVI